MDSKSLSKNFDFIWDNWIIPLSKKLYEDMDADFREFCNVRLKEDDFQNICIKASKYYLNKRKELKSEYYGKDYTDKHRMDFHKLSAIFCRTLIEYKLFDFDVNQCEKFIDQRKINRTNTDWLVKNALVNFRMAFYTSVVFLYQSMLFKYSNDVVIYNRLKMHKCLDLYKSAGINVDGKVHESFENCIVLDLAKRDINNRSFDYFMYSTIMFQLEEYNYNLLQNGSLL